MPNVFARTTKINNAVGRSAYISDQTHKQEEVVLHKASMVYDWKFYHEYELTHQKNAGQTQNEAREVLLPLPNELASQYKGKTTVEQKEKIEKICDDLAKEIVGENHDYEYAVHWNKARTNLHCHLMFSEREVVDLSLLEPKTYAKDIWQDPVTHKLTKKGVGKLVHKKGELMYRDGQPVYKTEPLSAKDTRYKEKSFMVQRDLAYQKIMSDHGYDFDINDNRSPYLSQKKLYKGASADYIAMAKDWNAEVKRYNENVKEHIQAEPQMEMEYISIKRDVLDNVREANQSEKRITREAVKLVKNMAYCIQSKTENSESLENSAPTYKTEYNWDQEDLAEWWQESREDLMDGNTTKVRSVADFAAKYKNDESNEQRLAGKRVRRAARRTVDQEIGRPKTVDDFVAALREFDTAIDADRDDWEEER